MGRRLSKKYGFLADLCSHFPGDKKPLSVEDLIIDRLCGCKFWRSEYDCEHAGMLLVSYKTKLDIKYLNDRVKAENLSELLGFEF